MGGNIPTGVLIQLIGGPLLLIVFWCLTYKLRRGVSEHFHEEMHKGAMEASRSNNINDNRK